MSLNTPWYLDALADLQLVMPTVQLYVNGGWAGVFVSSRGFWFSEGRWVSAQAYKLPKDPAGRRYTLPCGPNEDQQLLQAVRWRVHRIIDDLKRTLVRERDSILCTRMLERSRVDQFAKSGVAWAKLSRTGPPLHIALEWVGSVRDRAARYIFFVGDWMLG